MSNWKTLYVTAQDVVEGKRGNACECPIALAMYRTECKGGLLKTSPYIGSAEDMTIRPKGGGRDISHIEVHEEEYIDVEEFIELFDETGRVVSANNRIGFVAEDADMKPKDVVFCFRYKVNEITYNKKEIK